MKKLLIIIFILSTFNSFEEHATTKIVNGKRVALTQEEITAIHAQWAIADAKKTAENAKTKEQKIDESIQRDAILKVLFDLIVINSGKTKAEVLTMIKVEQNK